MTALSPAKNRDFDSLFERDFDDLVCGRRAGHMGHYRYVDAAMATWTNFIDTHADKYYIPRTEIELIGKAAKETAALLAGRPVTLVTRGCGTKFLAKEGLLLRHFQNVAGIVYLDRSKMALEQSMKEGRLLLPGAWHHAIQTDIYDSSLRYPVEGTEVGVSFGLTFMNIEGFPTSPPPKDIYMRNLSSINAQMAKGSHFIMMLDHNQDRESIEQAYAGEGEFAKGMLRRTQVLDADSVDFVVKFHRVARTLSHGFRFRHDAEVLSRSGVRDFKAGDVLWFNNSVKAEMREAMDWNKSSGFAYARPDIEMDGQSRIGWHHLVKG